MTALPSVRVAWTACLTKKLPDDVLLPVLEFTGTPTVAVNSRLGPVVCQTRFIKLQARRFETVQHAVNVGCFIRQQLYSNRLRLPQMWLRMDERASLAEIYQEFGCFAIIHIQECPLWTPASLDNQPLRDRLCSLHVNSGRALCPTNVDTLTCWLEVLLEQVDDWSMALSGKRLRKLWDVIEQQLLVFLTQLF